MIAKTKSARTSLIMLVAFVLMALLLVLPAMNQVQAAVAVKYTVQYNANGGTGTTKASTHIGNTPSKLTANGFTRTGYTFTSWNTKKDGSGTKYANKATVKDLTKKNGAKVTLYAQWKPVSVKIVFHGNGATSNTFKTQTYTYDKNGSKFVGTISRTGYTFLGWSTNKNATSASYKLNSSVSNSFIKNNAGKTLTLYAVWQKQNTVTLKFDGNGATSNTFKTQTFKSGVTGQKLVGNISRTGYRFIEWTGNKTFSNSLFSAYKDFLENKVAPTQITNIGVSHAAATGVNTLQYEKLSKNASISEAWIKKYNGKTATFYAMWEPNVYTITYDKNGGTGTMSKTYHAYDISQKLPGNSFTRSGYTFIGWNTKKDGTGTSYYNNASVKNLASTNGATVTLYAQWTPCEVIVGYYDDTTAIDMKQYKAGNGDKFLSAPCKPMPTVKASFYDEMGRLNIVEDVYEFYAWSTSPIRVWTTTNYGHSSGNTQSSSISVSNNAGQSAGTSNGTSWASGTSSSNGYSTGMSTSGMFEYAGWNITNEWIQAHDSSIVKLYACWSATEQWRVQNADGTWTYKQNYNQFDWQKYENAFIVLYNANGGEGTMQNAIFTSGSTVKLAKNQFRKFETISGQKLECEFLGWNTKADWSGTTYADGATIDITKITDKKITLYAMWDSPMVLFEVNEPEEETIVEEVTMVDEMQIFDDNDVIQEETVAEIEPSQVIDDIEPENEMNEEMSDLPNEPDMTTESEGMTIEFDIELDVME